MFPLFKRGGGGVLPCLEGGAYKVSDRRFSYFLPPLPIINDQSLSFQMVHSISKSVICIMRGVVFDISIKC